jgi:hypothetical protein
MTNITMPSELVVELLGKRGFSLDEHNRFYYASGSISNYTKLTIYQPRPYCSLRHDEEDVPACYIEYETSQEPGYLECDWTHTSKGYVAVEDLLKFLDEKKIRNRDEVKREREKYMAQLRAKKYCR